MKASIEGPRMSAATIQRKLDRVNARIAGGDYRLRPFRRSLRAQLAAIARKAGEQR